MRTRKGDSKMEKSFPRTIINEHDGNQEDNCVFGKDTRIITAPSEEELKNEIKKLR